MRRPRSQKLAEIRNNLGERVILLHKEKHEEGIIRFGINSSEGFIDCNPKKDKKEYPLNGNLNGFLGYHFFGDDGMQIHLEARRIISQGINKIIYY